MKPTPWGKTRRRRHWRRSRALARHEFSFLRELGYSAPQDADPADRFNVRFSNGELTLSIRGENWGKHAGVSAFGDGSGNKEKCPDILYEWHPARP